MTKKRGKPEIWRCCTRGFCFFLPVVEPPSLAMFLFLPSDTGTGTGTGTDIDMCCVFRNGIFFVVECLCMLK